MAYKFSLWEIRRIKVIELLYKTGRPYKVRDEGPCFSMYIFLPDKVDGLSEMMSKFGGLSSNSKPSQALSQTLGVLEYVQMKKVVIPMWKFCNRLEPQDTMKKLGLKLPFKTNRGEFTEMIIADSDGKHVYIGEVIQNAYIDVDEKGTEAAAVTAVVQWMSSRLKNPKPPSEEEFVADHPFMFMIVERNSKAVIFAGAVFNPLD